MTSRVARSALTAILVAATSAAPAPWTVDSAHSSLSFDIRHFVSKVPGRFTDFEGTIDYDPQQPEASRVEIVAKSASIDTDNEDRDQHLRSPDFFDVEKHPTLSFTSTAVKRVAEDRLMVTGKLTMRGVTQEVTLPVDILGTFQLPNGGAKAGFETRFTVDRKDFGISWNRVLDQGGAILGNEVNIRIAIEANAAPPEEEEES